MPTNVTIEFIRAKAKMAEAKTREEKIFALEEMLSACPNHKGCDVMRGEIKTKLAKLRKQSSGKTSRRITTIPKEGDAQVSLIGLTQSGKSTLLTALTNARPKISSRPYTTTKPVIGSINWTGVTIQLVEIPSTFHPMHMNIAQNCDGVVLVYKEKKDLIELKEQLSHFRMRVPIVEICSGEDPEKAKEKIWGILKLIRVYCKEPGKKPVKKALVLKRGTTVEKAADHVHKDFVKFFKFARVWGTSVKHKGERVGEEHILEDKDVLELRMA
jgi:ribosome-interacting GTPase 1